MAAARRAENLQVWSTLLALADLDEAWRLNRVILPLHNAVSYLYILAHVEPNEGDDLLNGFVESVGLLVAGLEQEPASP